MKQLIAGFLFVLFFGASLAQANENCELSRGHDLPLTASLYLKHGVMILNGVKFVNHTVHGRYDTGHYFTSKRFPGLMVQFGATGSGTHMYGFQADNSLFSYECRPAAQ